MYGAWDRLTTRNEHRLYKRMLQGRCDNAEMEPVDTSRVAEYSTVSFGVNGCLVLNKEDTAGRK